MQNKAFYATEIDFLWDSAVHLSKDPLPLYYRMMISPDYLCTPRYFQLQTEIRIHRALRHTFVCKFERYFEDNNNVYMLLELCSNNVRTSWLYCTFNQKLSCQLLQLETNIFSHQIIYTPFLLMNLL